MNKIIALSLGLGLFFNSYLANANSWVPGSQKTFCAKVGGYAPLIDTNNRTGEAEQLLAIPVSGHPFNMVSTGLTVIATRGKTQPVELQKFMYIKANTLYKVTGTMRLAEYQKYPTMDLISIIETQSCQ